MSISDAGVRPVQRGVTLDQVNQFRTRAAEKGRETTRADLLADAFVKVDISGDGRVTKDEVKQSVRQAADVNGDKGLSVDELQGAKDYFASKGIDKTPRLSAAIAKFSQLDRDGDGVLSQGDKAPIIA